MASKTNYEKNGSKYFRVTATVGKSPDGKPIKKEFYGKNKLRSRSKKRRILVKLKYGAEY